MGRMTVVNVPNRMPKLLIDKKAKKVTAKQLEFVSHSRLTPGGDEEMLLNPDSPIKQRKLPISNVTENMITEEMSNSINEGPQVQPGSLVQ